jgi:hypothetical protein
LVVNQVLFVLLAYTLVQAHLVLRRRQEQNRSVWESAWQLLSPTLEVVAVYYRQRFCLPTLAEYGRILLEVAEPVRAKLRDRLRRIERDHYSLLENARPPSPPTDGPTIHPPQLRPRSPWRDGDLCSLGLPARCIALPTQRQARSSIPERAPSQERPNVSPFSQDRRCLSPIPPSEVSRTV